MPHQADLFRKLATKAGMNIGYSRGTAVVPIITGDSWLAVKLSEAMAHRGVNVQPIMHPALEDHLVTAVRNTGETVRNTILFLGDKLPVPPLELPGNRYISYPPTSWRHSAPTRI